MKHITITQATQIRKKAEAGDDMAVIAAAYGIPIKRVEGISGISRKVNKADAKAEAKAEADSVTAAEEFE